MSQSNLNVTPVSGSKTDPVFLSSSGRAQSHKNLIPPPEVKGVPNRKKRNSTHVPSAVPVGGVDALLDVDILPPLPDLPEEPQTPTKKSISEKVRESSARNNSPSKKKRKRHNSGSKTVEQVLPNVPVTPTTSSNQVVPPDYSKTFQQLQSESNSTPEDLDLVKRVCLRIFSFFSKLKFFS